MADTNTPNILLLLPDLGDTFNFALHVENNFSTIDSLMGAVQCTTTTRPSNTYAGQIIYETDSKRYVQNTGTKASPVWTYMSHAALAVTAATHPTSGLSTGELIYETDTKYLQVYNGSSFEQKAYANLTLTSSTHPTSANSFVGEQIFETDTSNSLIWDGTGWRNIHTGPWTPYTPSWTTSGTAPAVGNGTLSGYYRKTGNTVTARVNLMFGTTTTLGTNAWQFSLPFTPVNNGNADGYFGTGFANNSGVAYYVGAAVVDNRFSATKVEIVSHNAASMWGVGVPAAWTISGSWVAFEITYESTT